MFIELFLLFLLGSVAGFVNVVAGGGSLLTMPMLIFFGLPSAVANGTNRIALMAQNVVAIASFKRHGYFDLKYNITLALPALVGSIFGANIAISLSDVLFNRILSVVMLVILVIMISKPHTKTAKAPREESFLRKLVLIIVFFFVGVYGGFIQAGVGFMIIAALKFFSDFSLVKINSMKVFIVAVYMASSLIVFMLNNQIHWGYGITLAFGTSIGAFFGSRFSIKNGEKWIQRILVVMVLGMSVKLFFT